MDEETLKCRLCLISTHPDTYKQRSRSKNQEYN